MNTAVILFVYNRYEHTKKVLDGLKKNNIDKLYVFCDGPKNTNGDIEVDRTRSLIKNIDWCEVYVEYKEENTGLANSVINGVSKVFNKGYDSVIVLEDDCIPHKDFINFMNKCFEFYNEDEEVMHICGFGLPINKNIGDDLYITPYPGSWGWGTWKKYWLECDFEQYENYKNLLSDRKELEKFNYCGEATGTFLDAQINGVIDSWLIRWYFHIFKNNGKCIWLKETMIYNSGFDGTGKHKVKFDRFNQKIDKDKMNKDRNIVFKDDLSYDQEIIREFRRFFSGRSILERVKTIIYMLTKIAIW